MGGIPAPEFKDPEDILVFLGDQGFDPSERKLGLLAVACCRRMWAFLPQCQRKAVEVAERVAEGKKVTRKEWNRLADAIEDQRGFDDITPLSEGATSAIYASFIDFRIHRVFNGAATGQGMWRLLQIWPNFKPSIHDDEFPEPYEARFEQERELELQQQCLLIHEILGDCFIEVNLDPGWLTPRVTAMADVIYKDRLFEDLPILADALEDAGCDNRDILDHLRGPGPHVRGCWALDLLLNKS